MPQARKTQVCIEDTPYYHITSRCVRRTFLCGIDKTTGENYEHRRQWIEERIRILSSIFTIDICAYAVMSNHYHIVVKLSPEQSGAWTDKDVVDRWTSLYKGDFLIQQWKANKTMTPAELRVVESTILDYRQRLNDLSWFMRSLNEPIARQANKEENCTGHFWESRFTSQPLLSEKALITCMSYADLNPIRAQMADGPEGSDHTSIKERIAPVFNLQEAIEQQLSQKTLLDFKLPLKPLLSFEETLRQEEQFGILFSCKEYLALVDETGRIIKDDKRGSIPESLPPILERLNISPQEWLENTTQFEQLYMKKFARRRKPKEKRLADTG